MAYETTATAAPAAEGKDAAQDSASIAQWRARIERAKKKRRDLTQEWSVNVDYRRGKPFATDTDEERVAVPIDWAQTKAKQAQLFSQVPQVMLTPKHPMFAPAVPVFGKQLNETLTSAKVGVAMDECLPDVINAAGVAVVCVGYEARTETKSAPQIDTLLLPAAAVAEVQKSPELMGQVTQPVATRFYVRRISPTDFLWPVEFKGSDFDDAPWVGYSGRMTWAEAKVTFQLDDKVKEDVVAATTKRSHEEQLAFDPTTGEDEADVVEFDELYYWAYRFHEDCKSYHKIRRIVFVRGITNPVIHEDWKGQQVTGSGYDYLGSCKFPVRVLTLTYISDEPIPPSDSAIGRPQVDELIRTRSQMAQQRDYSMPMRWFDVNRVDPQIMDALMKGTWQGMIPTNGDGSRVIGEVARAQYPHENYDIDRIIKNDLSESWQIGPNQVGAFTSGERSASEAQIVQANFSTRIGYERARVGAFFCGIAEVMGGLLSLFGDFAPPNVGEDELQRLEAWDRQSISSKFVYTIRADSTVLLDSNQRLQKLNNFLNLTAKSGYVDVEPILREMAALSGLDPDLIIRRPQPQGPEPPNVSFRFSSEDVTNPIALALLIKTGQAPTPEELQAAKNLLAAAMGVPVMAPAVPAGAPMTNPLAPEVGGDMLPADALAMTDRMPEWQMGDRINTRRDDGSV